MHPAADSDTPTIFHLFEGIESLEFHNNVVRREGAASVTLVRAVEAQWTQGVRVCASNNWVKSGFALNPSNLPAVITGTLTGAAPGFSNPAGFAFTPANGSPLLDATTAAIVTPPDCDPPDPLLPPTRHPPPRNVLPAGSALLRPLANPIDFGACERDAVSTIFAHSFEPQS
jgi:hypothetical protein